MRHKIQYMKREIEGLGTLYYVLLHDRVTTSEGRLSSYGVEVSLHTERGEKRATAGDITPSRRKIEHILMLLHRNSVMPCTLHEVLEELL